jgi:peptide/nickel transport system ATP-binding protein
MNQTATGNASVIEVKDLTISYRTHSGLMKAVDGISFNVRKGEILGLAGESACGKTTTALSIMRLQSENATVEGQVLFEGKNVLQMPDEELRAFRWSKVSLIPQGSMNSLDPVIQIGKQITEAIRAHEKVSGKQAWQRAEKLLSSVSIHASRAKNYPHEFSGGMKQRSVIAMALALNPSLVIADEPTTALDVVVQKQLLELLKDLKRRWGISFLFVSHDLSVIGEIADRVAVMYAGKIVEIGKKDDVLKHPAHPYTQALVNSVPRIWGARQALHSIPGSPPTGVWPAGCRFHPRCEYAFELCKQVDPELQLSKTNTLAACHLITHEENARHTGE